MDARSKAHEGGTAEVQQAQASGRAGSRRGATAAPALSASDGKNHITSTCHRRAARFSLTTSPSSWSGPRCPNFRASRPRRTLTGGPTHAVALQFVNVEGHGLAVAHMTSRINHRAALQTRT